MSKQQERQQTTDDGIRPYGPGKFNTYIDSYVYDASLDGNLDEQCGESESTGWYGLMVGTTGGVRPGLIDCVPSDVVPTDAEDTFLRAQAGAILSENSQGFVDVEYYTDHADLMKAWDAVSQEIEEEYST